MALSIAFQHYLKTHILDGKKVGIAISGGLDSIVLAHLFIQYSPANVELLHVNYGLRGGESNGDEDFLYHFSKKYKVPLHVFKCPVNLRESKGIQEKARKIRYAWFEQLIRSKALDYIATAHHQNDNVETLLFRLIRKTGLNGLTGISEYDYLLRPLLPFSKEAISNYALQNKLEWREDSSNAKYDYSRNSLRHLIVAPLIQHFPQALENIHQTAIQLKNTQSVLNDLIGIYKNQFLKSHHNSLFSIQKKDIATFHSPALFLYFLIENMHFNLNQCEEMWQALQNNRSGATWHQTEFDACVHDHTLVFVRKERKNAPQLYKIEWGESSQFVLQHLWFKLQVNTQNTRKPEAKDYCLRFWKQGDKMQYTKSGKHKKLSDIFTENKIPVILRNKLPIVLYKDKIIKIAGITTSKEGLPVELKKKAEKIELHTLLLFGQ